MSAPPVSKVRRPLAYRRLERLRKINPENGKAENNVTAMRLLDAGTAVVVPTVKVTAESSLPEPTCGGLKPHVVKAGSFEQANDTLLGNDPLVGFTSRLNMAGCPAVKSKFWLGVVMNVTAAE